jgi:hypothetical protein
MNRAKLQHGPSDGYVERDRSTAAGAGLLRRLGDRFLHIVALLLVAPGLHDGSGSK